MPLPVLNESRSAGFDPVRAYARALLDWGRAAAADESEPGYGTRLVNADLPTVTEANCVLDAYLTGEQSAAAVVADADAWFSSHGTACRGWTLNPSLPPNRTEPLAICLRDGGWRPHPLDVFRLVRQRPNPPPCPPGVTLLPARSAYPAHGRLAAGRWPADPARAAAAELHLDDPRVDAVVAVAAGRAVGSAHLLNAGDVGTVMDLYVAPPDRRRGVGSALLGWLLDTAARAGHRHVLAAAAQAGPGGTMMRQAGFAVVGSSPLYLRLAR